MRTLTKSVGPVVVLSALASACAGVPLPREGLSDPGQILFNGYAKPEVDCYRCHNGDGHGARGPDLATRVPGLTDDGIKNTIMDGKGWGMPSFKGKASDQDVAQLASWLRANFGKKPEAPAAK